MKWIVVLVCVIVLSEILSIADGQIQLTVDVAGGTKTLVNIRSEASDIPPDVTRTGALSRKKRASAIRPFSTEIGDEASADYQTFPDMGSSGSSNLGSQSNFGGSGAGGGGGSPPFGRQPGGFPPPPGAGDHSGGGPRGRQQMKRKCRGSNNSRGCRDGGNMQGNNGRRRRGNRRPMDDYDGGNWMSGPPSRGSSRRHNHRITNSEGGDASYNY